VRLTFLPEQLTSMAPMRFKDQFHFAQVALRQDQQEIVVGHSHGKIRPAAAFFKRRANSFNAWSAADKPLRCVSSVNSSGGLWRYSGKCSASVHGRSLSKLLLGDARVYKSVTGSTPQRWQRH